MEAGSNLWPPACSQAKMWLTEDTQNTMQWKSGNHKNSPPSALYSGQLKTE